MLRQASSLELSTGALENALELMPYASWVTITPMGEPLLYSRFGRILERHREAGCRNLAMTTNGNLIDDARARLLVEGGMQHIIISVDAAEPAPYGEIRRGGSLEAVESAIAAVNCWKQRLNSSSPVLRLNGTFLERNIRQMPLLVDFASRHGITEYGIQHMEVENPDLASEHLANHLELTHDMVSETLKRAECRKVNVGVHLGLATLLTRYRDLQRRQCGAAKDNGKNGSHGAEKASARARLLTDKCRHPMEFLLVDTDGDCRPCSCAGLSMGNLHEYSYDEIWNSPPALKIRADFYRNHIPLACQGRLCQVEYGHTGTIESAEQMSAGHLRT